MHSDFAMATQLKCFFFFFFLQFIQIYSFHFFALDFFLPTHSFCAHWFHRFTSTPGTYFLSLQFFRIHFRTYLICKQTVYTKRNYCTMFTWSIIRKRIHLSEMNVWLRVYECASILFHSNFKMRFSNRFPLECLWIHWKWHLSTKI